MTDEELLTFFWNKYQETYEEFKSQGLPISQTELYKKSLRAVIDESLKRESIKQAEQYLNFGNH